MCPPTLFGVKGRGNLKFLSTILFTQFVLLLYKLNYMLTTSFSLILNNGNFNMWKLTFQNLNLNNVEIELMSKNYKFEYGDFHIKGVLAFMVGFMGLNLKALTNPKMAQSQFFYVGTSDLIIFILMIW